MNSILKSCDRLFRRGWGVYYSEDTQTGKQVSLETTRKEEAQRLVQAKNEGEQHPAFSLQLARVYWKAGDSAAGTRTWQFVMDEIIKTKHDNTRHRWETAIKDNAFDFIRNRVILETNAEHFLRVLEEGAVSTNIYVRRIHNFALDMGWLPWPVVPKKQWPPVQFGEKRAITLDEHQAILDRERNPERKAFYELAWHLGASQTDIALLEAENIDWRHRVISYCFLPDPKAEGTGRAAPGVVAVLTVWNPKQPATVTLAIRRTKATLVNTIGEERALETRQGEVQLTLPVGKAVYIQTAL